MRQGADLQRPFRPNVLYEEHRRRFALGRAHDRHTDLLDVAPFADRELDLLHLLRIVRSDLERLENPHRLAHFQVAAHQEVDFRVGRSVGEIRAGDEQRHFDRKLGFLRRV